MKLILTTLFILLLQLILSQEIHDKPYFPKGTDATQLKALPHYNEACLLYKEGRLDLAKNALKKAVNISFALTEAQMFLGDILFEQERYDSATYYYNSGIDFIIEQKPHYYFKLFESGMKCGNYDIVKQNLKHFKKLYGKHAFTAYEEGYRYTRSDFEFYERCMNEVDDFQNWLPSGQVYDSLNTKNGSIAAMGNDWVRIQEGKRVKLSSRRKVKTDEVEFFKEKNGIFKKKEYKFLPEFAEDFFLTISKNYLFFNDESEGITKLFVAEKKGGKWKVKFELPASINEGSWTAQAFYNEEDELLYFASEEEGNKDLFVAQYNVQTNEVFSVNPLKRINTTGDEMSPFFHEGIFYFASNGLEGFGGFDIYKTHNNEVVNGVLYPTNYHQMGYSFSTHHDETKFIINDKNEIMLLRKNRFGEENYLYIKKLLKKDKMYMEIHIEPLN